MENYKEKVTVIIRSVGERTEQLCRELILAQGLPESNLVIVREAPFSAAMKKSFEIGIERGLPWTFCVDADVLLRPGAVEKMVALAERQEEKVCEIQGYVLDKFFGGPRPAGNHLYRTTLLPKVIEQIPPEGRGIRPESHTLEAMRAMGYPWALVNYLTGLHDFEQYYRDIFRKSFVQAHKHQYLTDLFLDFWRGKAAIDPDYKVALKGFAKGVEYCDLVYIDINQKIYKSEFYRALIQENAELSLDDYSLDIIEDIIQNWEEPAAYISKFPTKMGLKQKTKNLQYFKIEIINKINEIGFILIIPHLFGLALTKLGKKLVAWTYKSSN